MLCETCGRRNATVFYREKIDGQVREFSLCDECTEAMRRSGELEELGTACPGSPSPQLMPEEPPLREARELWMTDTDHETGKACPRCGVVWGDTVASGGIGCAECYATFAVELAPLMPVLCGRVPYGGSVPSSVRVRQERRERVASLRRELSAAVRAERYEDAAILRDSIRKLEKEVGGHGVV